MNVGKSQYEIYSNGKVVMRVTSTWGAAAEKLAAKKLNVNYQSIFALPCGSSYMDQQIAVANSMSRYKKYGDK